jgi:hypothetical protein
MAEQRHVIPNPDGGWDVKAPNAGRESVHYSAQTDAIAGAREILRMAGGGELVIYGRDGQIHSKFTVSSGNDPYPPRG